MYLTKDCAKCATESVSTDVCVCACVQQAVVMVTRVAVGGDGDDGDHLGVSQRLH